jgi:integrase
MVLSSCRFARGRCRPSGSDWAEWGELLQRAGVRQVRLHDGRHTAATLLLEQGVHVRAIQRILGHSDVRTTEAYTHVGDQMTRDAARRMGAALWGE